MSLSVSGNGGHEVTRDQQLLCGVQILDHRHLLVGIVRERELISVREIGDLAADRPHEPFDDGSNLVSSVHLSFDSRQRTDAVNLEVHTERTCQVVNEGRVDCGIANELDTVVVFTRITRLEFGREKEQGCTRDGLSRLILRAPRNHSPGKEQGLDSSLFVVLEGLLADSAKTL